MRCVKTKMKDLQIGVDGQNYYKPDSFMGHPNILFIENSWLCSKLFAVEQVFKSKRDCLLDNRVFSEVYPKARDAQNAFS